MNELKKEKNLVLRITEEDNANLSIKSKLLNIGKSELIRDAAKGFWSGDFDASLIYNEYTKSDEQRKNNIVNILAEFFTRKGYPHNRLTKKQLLSEMHKLSKTKNPLLENNHLQINTVGLSLANHFHHHMVKVKCLSSYRSPYEQFSDIDLLKDSIKRWMELGNKPLFSGIRRILRTRDGVRSVVNFKPAIGKYFYDQYCPENGLVLDPCSGYGARLTACISTNRNIFYHGIDPHGPTANGNMKLASFFIMNNWKFKFRFDLGCSEDVMKNIDTKYDLIFTSPPFFNTEKYSNHSMQSWIRYPKYNEWIDGFLSPLVCNSARIIKNEGNIVINVKNYKKYPIADDLLTLADKFGLKLHKTYHMRLPNSEFKLTAESKWHTEPIFVFNKVSNQKQ